MKLYEDIYMKLNIEGKPVVILSKHDGRTLCYDYNKINSENNEFDKYNVHNITFADDFTFIFVE